MKDKIGTPYGEADSYADAVVRYTMHNEIAPLAYAQAARDQWEQIAELARIQYAALKALLAEHAAMNADLRAIGKGRPEDGAHPDCPAEMARAAVER